MNSKKSNRLLHATSPYLLQHAYNPVDWYEWGAEALQKALREDKPILVSIGYSSCHWCHVMERESFENEDIAAIMNEFFVCIKVDREERPDVDHVYMDAVQAMGQHGGWPLNVFLTPDQKPFYGGTYFPPQKWVQVLTGIHKSYSTRRNEVKESASELANHLEKQTLANFKQPAELEDTSAVADQMYENLRATFDYADGGMDKAPKFIMPSVWLWLLRYWHLTKKEEALQHTCFTLKKIAFGGIYDQVGGGFARYSVDTKWFAPHFEKMLYDNAQLISLYAEAFQITHDPIFKKIVYETIAWLSREMTSSEGAFYAALDADSEGIEGKYYCWTDQELQNTLGEEVALATAFFSASPEGNWEHGMNILTHPFDKEIVASQFNLNRQTLDQKIENIKNILLSARNNRIKPGLDDKILTGWNAMTISALIDAYHAFNDKQFLSIGLRAAGFIKDKQITGVQLYRSFKGKRSDTEGFLEDYAFTIQAWIKLYEATFQESWLMEAVQMITYVIENFYDKQEGYFFYSSNNAEKLIARKKEIFDNVIPSSNGIMAQNLFRLGTLMDRNDWITMARKLTTDISQLIVSEPNYMANWGIVLTEINFGISEVAFTGNTFMELKSNFKQHYTPFTVVMGSVEDSEVPLLQNKVSRSDTGLIYVCFDKTCQLPVVSVEEALEQLKN